MRKIDKMPLSDQNNILNKNFFIRQNTNKKDNISYL